MKLGQFLSNVMMKGYVAVRMNTLEINATFVPEVLGISQVIA